MTRLRRPRLLLLALIPLALVAACATPAREPLRVNVASVQRIDGAAMELRFVARLRVQNVNDGPVEYSGASAELMLNGKTIGTGVSDGRGSVPRMGEAFVDVPVTVSALGEVRQAIGLYGAPDRKLDTVLKGRLAGAGPGDLSFEWRGELAMPLPKGS
jgi:LEA14-like dessication related protein